MSTIRVRVAEGRQVVPIEGGPVRRAGAEIEIEPVLARKWISWGWVVPVDGGQAPPAPDGPSVRHHRANVRARIREELKTDHDRSDRTVASVVGCDHKTVGAVRTAMQDSGELPQPSDT